MSLRAPLIVRCSRLAMVALAIACWLLAGQSAQAVTINELREAWQKHSASFNAIRYKLRQAKTEAMYTKATNDPFALPAPDEVKERVSLKGSLTFLRAGDKTAVTRVAEFWDDQQGKPIERKQMFSFDGKQSSSYFGSLAGRIESTNAAGDSLNNSVELIPLWWAHWPEERLLHYGDVRFEDIRISKEILTCNGAACIELTIIPQTRPDSVQRIYVDPANGFRVVRVNQFYKDVLRRELTLEYENDENLGWNVASFKSNYFDQGGEPSFTIESEVHECEFNPQLTERSFQIDFPVGTLIGWDGKKFRQEENGELREVNAKEPRGATPKQDGL